MPVFDVTGALYDASSVLYDVAMVWYNLSRLSYDVSSTLYAMASVLYEAASLFRQALHQGCCHLGSPVSHQLPNGGQQRDPPLQLRGKAQVICAL